MQKQKNENFEHKKHRFIYYVKLVIKRFFFIFGIVALCAMIIIDLFPIKDHEVQFIESIRNSELSLKVKYKLPIESGCYIKKIKNIRFTAYNNHAVQTDSTPNITGSQRMVYEGSVAVSQDLLKGTVKYGDLAYVESLNKFFIIEDAMNKRYIKRMDIFLFDKKEALKVNFSSDIIIFRLKR